MSAQLLVTLNMCRVTNSSSQSPGEGTLLVGSSAIIVYHKTWSGFFVGVILARCSLGDPYASTYSCASKDDVC